MSTAPRAAAIDYLLRIYVLRIAAVLRNGASHGLVATLILPRGCPIASPRPEVR